MIKRQPDLHLGAYLRRWWLIPRNRFGNIYLHHFSASDGGDLHDHPWVNCSIVLSGRYREHFHDGTYKDRGPGSVVCRGALTLHRLELLTPVVKTLFLTGPARRRWGFLTGKGWVDHRDYDGAQRFSPDNGARQ